MISNLQESFIRKISDYHSDLVKSIRDRNPDSDAIGPQRAAVLLIKRMVFLRLAEVREGRVRGTLRGDLDELNAVFHFHDLFSRARKIYRCRFFNDDPLISGLRIDSEALQSLIVALYERDTRGAFVDLPVEIMGRVHELFPSGIGSRSLNETADVEDRRRLRNSNGIFYTPPAIVEYIVGKTLGPRLRGASPGDLQGLRLIDPACGSGNFLLFAYRLLLSFHLAAHIRSRCPDRSLQAGHIEPAADGTYRLSESERRRILKEHIHGIDADAEAVEIARLSLYLESLAGPVAVDRESDFRLRGRRKSVGTGIKEIDLVENIRCGNSLLDFAWSGEFPASSPPSFPERGFDCVIGNPPYILLEDRNGDQKLIERYRKNYRSAAYKIDTYHLFLELGVRLLGPGGRLGYITPANYFTNNGLGELRSLILDNCRVEELNAIAGRVFPGAAVDTAISIFRRGRSSGLTRFHRSIYRQGVLATVETLRVDQERFRENPGSIFLPPSNRSFGVDVVPLGSLFRVRFGMQLRDRRIFSADVIGQEQKELITDDHRPCITGRDLSRYYLDYGGLLAYVNREARRGGCWDPAIHQTRPKIIVRQIGETPICALDTEGYHCLNTVFMIAPRCSTAPDLHFVLAALNSRLLQNYWRENFADSRRTFPKIKGSYLERMPLPAPTTGDGGRQNAIQCEISGLVRRLLVLKKDQARACGEVSLSAIAKRIAVLERRIDVLIESAYRSGAIRKDHQGTF